MLISDTIIGINKPTQAYLIFKMISLEKCKQVLNKGRKTYTDQEVSKIREFLYQLAEIQMEVINNLNKKK